MMLKNYVPKPESFYKIPDAMVGESPCHNCIWQCINQKEACQELWDWLAKRGDLRMKYREEVLKE